jgi:peptide/nickel transport system permease protein
MFGLIMLLVLTFCAIFAPYIAPFHYNEQDLDRTFVFPNRTHIMGTDNFGRDIFSRVIFGTRVSLSVGLIAVTIAMAVGCTIGSVAGFYGGKIENYLMRLIDIFMAIPSIILAIAIAAALGPGLVNVMITVGIGTIPAYARIVRASVLTIRGQEFVEAARAIGARDLRIILKHILPNCLAPIIVQATLGVASAILSIAALSFIGLGITPPTPEWGSMLSAGRTAIMLKARFPYGNSTHCKCWSA